MPEKITDNCVAPSCGVSSFSEETELKRDLGLLEAVSIVIGRIIGSGIFRTPAPILAAVGCMSLFGIVWLTGGLITIFGAFCYAELTAMMPRSGGPYIYLKEAYGPLVAFLRGWAMFFVSETASIVSVALVFSESFNEIWKTQTGANLEMVVIVCIAFVIIWLLTLVNLFGVYLSGQVQNVFSAAKIIAIGFIIGIAFTHKGSFAHVSPHFWPASWDWNMLDGIGEALALAFFAFSGWEGATYIAEEVKQPRKNLPLSLFFGIGGVTLLYISTNAAYLYQVPFDTFIKSKIVSVDAMQAAIGGFGGVFISIAIMISTFGNVGTQILCKARTWHAMARDGLFFKKLAYIHPKYKTPNNALLLQAVWATVLLICAALAKTYSSGNKSMYVIIIKFFSATGAVFTILTFLSVFVLRKKYPHADRPYKVWLYPVSLIIVVFFYVFYLLLLLKSGLISSLLGFLLTLTGLVFYYYKIRKKDVSKA